jgi:Ras-related protein Rab-8A
MSRQQEQPYDIHIKILMLGDSGVGKTSLLLRYAQDEFSPTFISTIGIDFKVRNIIVDDLRAKLQIWDTAGQERFRAITTSYFKGSHAVLLLYDVTDRDSFTNIHKWARQIRDLGDLNTNIVLVGNKADDPDKRNVSEREGTELAKSLGLTWFEVSAKHNRNVSEAFMAVATETKRRLLGETRKAGGVALAGGKGQSGGGCC